MQPDCTMELSAEARRIMAVALGKLYSSRSQRGGLRLHRSLLLTQVMKSARDIYHAARAAGPPRRDAPEDEPRMDNAAGSGASPDCPRTQTREDVDAPAERGDAHDRSSGDAGSLTFTENKENEDVSGLSRHARKRRGKAATEPDFIPCKKAKIEEGKGLQQLALNSVLRNSVNCAGMIGSSPSPVPLPRPLVVF